MAKKIAMYALAGILVTGYLLVLILGRGYSGKSEAYRIFFTDQKLDVYISEEDWKNVFSCGRAESLDETADNRNVGQGWGRATDEKGRWTDAESAYVYFYVEDGDCAYRAEIGVLNGTGGHSRVTVNGTDAGELVFDRNTGTVKIEKGLIHSGINELGIRTESGERLFVNTVGLFREE